MAKGMMQPAGWRSTTLLVSEGALIFGVVAASGWVRLGEPAWPLGLAMWPKALLITSICQLCMYYGDLYDNPHAGGDRGELIIRTLQALGATFLILAGIYTVFPAVVIARGVVAPAAAVAVAGVVAWRLTFLWVARQVGPRERLLLVGASGAGLALARELTERSQLGVQIVGLVDAVAPEYDAGSPLAYLGGVEDIPAIVRARSVDRVVVSLADARGKLPMQKLLEMKLDGVTFDHLSSVYEEYTGKIAVENLRPSWLIFSPGFRKTRRLMAMKRMLDVLSAAVGLILSAPIIMVLAVIVRWTSPGPVFYSQRRVGCDGRMFKVFKLRSMCNDAERHTGPVWVAHGGDSRITPIGRFMRRTRLDELPQFWNILIGQMSLVGPRPERPEFVQSLAQQIPFYGTRHVVRPGLTGWAQVRYTYGATVEDAIEKLQYDLFYIKNLSITLDLFIMFETVKTVILRKGQ